MKNGTVSINQLSYQELLKNHAEPYVQVIARKYNSQCAELCYEDLCQEGRMKLWQHYNYYIKQRASITVEEVIKIFKRTMTNLCKDLQRKHYFAERRSVNRTIDLDSMLEAVEEGRRVPASFMESVFNKSFRLTMLDLETQDLLDYLKTRLQPLEGRILEEMVNPSERLIEICQKDKRKRITYRIHLYYFSELLGKSYAEIRNAFDNVGKIVREVCLTT